MQQHLDDVLWNCTPEAYKFNNKKKVIEVY